MLDTRLLGTWKSDKRRTAREVVARKDFKPNRKAKLLSLFGKLELRYTRTHCHSRFDGEKLSSGNYHVVAKNSESVVVVTTNPISGDVISHLHFEGPNLYWVSVAGRFREYFRRISK